MDEILYKKVGKRYVPVGRAWNDVEWLPFGYHLVSTTEHSKSYKFKIDPDYVGLLAAAQKMRCAMEKKMLEENKMQPEVQPLTEKQRKLLDAYEKSVDKAVNVFYRKCVAVVVDVGIQVLIEETKNEKISI